LKFKYLIITFSIIIVIIIIVTAFLPALLTRGGSGFEESMSFAAYFRYISLPLILFMVLLLVCMSIFFLLNYRQLSLLEREDWPALAYYLEQKIFVKRRYNTRNVRLLSSSYLVISDYLSVLKLEKKAQIARPSVVSKNVLLFGAARILNNNPDEAAAFFRMHLKKCRSRDKQWVYWFYGFSQLLAGDFSPVESIFSSLAISSKDALITGLCAYFLNTSLEKKSINPQKCRETAEIGKNRIKKALKNHSGWKKEVDRMGTDIHIAIIKKYIDEAGNWLFENKG
jgi:hypothetical protein